MEDRADYMKVLEEKETRITSLEESLRENEAALIRIYNSGGWNALLRYYGFRDKLLPFGSRRREIAGWIKRNFFSGKVERSLPARTIRVERKEEAGRDKGEVQLIEVAPVTPEPDHSRRPRVAFVGQPVYFRFMYEQDLEGHYDVGEFELKWGANEEYYKGLIEFNPHAAFFFRPELYPDGLLNALRGIKVALSSEPIPKRINGRTVSSADMKLRFESLRPAKDKNYDYFFHYDRTSLEFLRHKGFNAEEFCFPVAVGTYRYLACPRKWDWGFIGRGTPHRERFLGPAKRDYNGLHIAHGIYGEDFVRMVNECRIGINLHMDQNISLEPRMQMMMACRTMVMSEPPSYRGIFRPGVHYVEFTHPQEFLEKLAYYLDHEDEREEIALNGFNLVREELGTRKIFPELINRVLDENRNVFFQHAEAGKCLKLDLGCGKFKKEDFIGIDIEQYGNVDVLSDLNEPLPFPDNSVSEIFCSHALEHVKDPRNLLKEMHRVSLPGSTVDLIVPLHEPDPTHFTVFDEKWFEENLDTEKFHVLLSSVHERSGVSPSGKVHGWTEQRITLKSLKPGTAALPKPSIGFVIPRAEISGGIMVVCQHANRLARKGYNVVILSNTPDDPSSLDWFPSFLPKVMPINKLRKRIDIAVATHWTTAYAVRDFPSRRKIYFVQSDETRFGLSGRELKLARRTYAFDLEFIAIAKWIRDWLADSFCKPAALAPNAVDPSIFYPDEPLSPKGDRLRILLEGPIDVPFKGMEDAFRVVHGMECEVWCVSNAGRPRPGWKCDRFFEKASQEMMRKIYSSCDLLIKMSRVEGFFMPPLEMMACGGAVITGKVTGFEEYIVEGYNALVVEQGDISAAREKLALLIKDRELLERLKKGGMETAGKWSSWDRSNDLFEDVIQRDPAPKSAGSSRAGELRTDRKDRLGAITGLANPHYLKRTFFYLRNYGFRATFSKIRTKVGLLRALR